MTGARAQSASTARLKRIPAQLRGVFGLRQLRPGQRDVIERALRGLNTLAVMPTGAGKSLCYQLPATLLPGLTVVVSPLIALMQDQCEKLNALGVKAEQLNSALDAQHTGEAEAAVADGSARVVFVTPERLAEPAFAELLKQREISLLVVDEAHCISQWGHDFRPAFTEIGTALPALGKPPVLALTATASEDVTDDVAKQLGIPSAGVLTGSSYRPNLHYSVEPIADEAGKLRRTVELVAQGHGPTIVYAATVKAAEAVHQALLDAGVPASLYHGKLRAAQRQAAQQAFMHPDPADPGGQRAVMVATNAFGLGIDKPDIRLVVHYQLPAGLDVYYQESGRAGRDGEPARCALLFLSSDKAVQQFFLNGRYPSLEDGQGLLRHLSAPPPAEAPGWTLALLKERMQRPLSKLRVLVNLLKREQWLKIDEQGLITLDGQAPQQDIDALLKRYAEKSEQDHQRLEQMVFYAQSGACRWRVLLDFFDESPDFERCQHCDNCRRMAAHERAHEQAAQPAPVQITARPGPAAADGASDPPASPRARFAAGSTVWVKRYGAGTVTEASTESVTVEFGTGQRRCFHPEFVRPGRRR